MHTRSTVTHARAASAAYAWLRVLLAMVAALGALAVVPATSAALAPVINPTVTPGDGQVTVNWTNPGTPDFTDTKIYRKDGIAGTWNLVQTVAAPGNSWVDNTVTNQQDYYYRVRAFASGSGAELPAFTSDQGVYGLYYDNQDYTGLKGGKIDPNINFNWGSGYPSPLTGADQWSISWTGWIYVDYNELYTFYSTNDDAVWMAIDGTTVLNVGCCGTFSGSIMLTQGWHTFAENFAEATSSAYAQLEWQSASLAREYVPQDHLRAREQDFHAVPQNVSVDVTAPDGGETFTTSPVTINWTPSYVGPAPQAWRIDVSTDGGSSYATTIATVAGTDTSYDWTPTAGWNSSQTRVRVTAVSPDGTDLAADASAGDFDVDLLPVEAIENFTATPGSNQVGLTWSNPADPTFDHVIIYRSTQEGDIGAPIHASAGPGETSWTDFTVSNGTNYWYRARSVDIYGASGPTVAQGSLLNYSAYSDTGWSNWQYSQQWPGVISYYDGKSGYDCEASNLYPHGNICGNSTRRWWGMVYVPTGGSYTFYTDRYSYARLWIDGTMVVDAWSNCNCEASGATTLTAGWHDIRVDHGSVADWSEIYVYWSGPGIGKQYIPTTNMAVEPEVHAQPSGSTITLNAPVGGETVATGEAMNIDWTTVAPTAGDFVTLYWSDDGGGSWRGLKTWLPTTGNMTWQVPEGVDSGTVRVRAVLRSGNDLPSVSDDSGDIAIHTTAPYTSPVTNVQVAPGNSQAAVSWTNPADPNFDHVVVYRSTDENDIGTIVYTSPDNTTTNWTDNTLTNSVTYYYRVHAADATGQEAIDRTPGQIQYTQYDNNQFTDFLTAVTTTGQISMSKGQNGYDAWVSPASPQKVISQSSARWIGWIYAPQAGDYSFDGRGGSQTDDGMALHIDGMTIYSNFAHCQCDVYDDPRGIYLTQGWHEFSFEFEDWNWQSSEVYLYWQGPGIGRQIVPMANLAQEPIRAVTPSDASLSISNPTAGQTYHTGENMDIQWTGSVTGATETRIGVSLDGGASYQFNLVRWQPSTGSFTWNIPEGYNSTQARIRIELDGANRRPVAYADSGDFTIDTTQPGPAPVSNVTVTAGFLQNLVAWTNPGDPNFDHVVVYRSTLERSLGSIVYTSPDNTTTSWMDTGLANDQTYYYRVRSVDAAGNETADITPNKMRMTWYDDNGFNNWLDTVQSTQPISMSKGQNGYDAWVSAMNPQWVISQSSIRWVGHLYAPSTGYYRFDTRGGSQTDDGAALYVDGVTLFSTFAGCQCDVYGDTGAVRLSQGWHEFSFEFEDWNWQSSEVYLYWQGPGISRTLVPVTSFGSEPIEVATPSDATISLTNPVAGQTYGADDRLKVQWAGAASTANSVRVGLSLDGGATWPSNLAIDQPVTGSFTWLVPDGYNTSQARIRVQLVGNSKRLLATAASGDFTIDSTPGPLPVTGLQVTNGNGQVQLSWTNPADVNFDHAVVYRSSNDYDPGQVVYTAPDSSVSSWTDTGLTNGNTYFYRVRAADAAGHISRNLTSGQLREDEFKSYMPGRLRWHQSWAGPISFSYADSYGPYTWTQPGNEYDWADHSRRWSGYVYAPTTGDYRFDTRGGSQTDDGATLNIDGTTDFYTWAGCQCDVYGDTGAVRLTQGWHRINVEWGDWDWRSSEMYLYWQGPGIGRALVPAANFGEEEIADGEPTLAVLAINSPTTGATLTGQSVTLDWTEAGMPSHRIGVDYSTDSGATWIPITERAGSSPMQWTLPGSTNSSTVRLRLRAYDYNTGLLLTSVQTGDFSVDTTSLQPVSGVTVIPGWTTAKLSWTESGAGIDHVNIYRSTTNHTTGPLLQVVPAGVGTWTDTGLTTGNTYYYTLRAADAAGKEVPRIKTGVLLGSYYDGVNFNTFKGSQEDGSINFNWGGGHPALVSGNDNYSVQWHGYYHVTTSGVQTFDTWNTNEYMNVFVGGARLIDYYNLGDYGHPDQAARKLTPGWYPIDVAFSESTGSASAYLYEQPQSGSRAILAGASIGIEAQTVAVPTDITPPDPNPVGSGAADSPTQITWQALGASDSESGLDPSPYSFDGGTSWQVADSYVRTGLAANTMYSQTIRVRDVSGNMTTSKIVPVRTLALAPTVTPSQPTGTWLGPNAVTIDYTNNAVWGPGGIEYYRYVFDQTATHTFTDSETVWNSGVLSTPAPSSGAWYLHLKSYNADDVTGGTLDVGPFWVDITAPTPDPPTVGHTPTATSVTFTVDPMTDVDSGLDPSAYSFDGCNTWQAPNTYSVGSLGYNTPVTVNVCVRDAVGNETSIGNATDYTSAADPDVSVAPAPDATWRVSGSVFTLTNNIGFGPGAVAGYRVKASTLATDVPDATDANWTSGTYPEPIVGTSAAFYIHVRAYNGSGDLGATQHLGPFKLDGTPPPATTPLAAADPTNTDPQIAWTGVVDAESGLGGYRVFRSTVSGALGSQIADIPGTTYQDTGPLVDGTRYYYTVQAYDSVGNQQAVGNVQVGVTYDTAAPSSPTIDIDGGNSHTGSSNVTLSLASPGATEMIVGNQPDLSDGSWEPIVGSKAWTLLPGEGIRTVYARYRNASGTQSSIVADTITVDTTPPTPNPPTGGGTPISATSIQWYLDPLTDPGAGAGLHAQPYSFTDGSTWQAAINLTEGSLAPNTTYTKHVRARDAVLNQTAQGTLTATTLAAAPAVSSVPAPDGVNTQPLGQTITFTNDAGWGAGAVEYYRWAWDANPGYVFTGAEPMWSGGAFTRQEWSSSTWYLHVKSYNSDDQGGQELTLGPYMFAPPTGSQTVYVNVGTYQTLSCNKTDFTIDLVPGISDDAMVDCDVTSNSDWNLVVHASAAPFFTDFTDFSSTPQAYAGPASTDGQVAFTVSGTKSDPVFAAGTQWRGFVGTTDISMGGDTVATGGTETLTTRVRAELGAGAVLPAGVRSQTMTYTLSPGPP